MSTIESGLYAKLSAATAVSSLVSTRIRPGFADGKDTLPLLVVNRISTVAHGQLDGACTLEEARFQIDSHASTDIGARALADAVRGVLDGVDETWSSKQVKIAWRDQDDTPAASAGNEEARRYGVRQDYTIWHSL